MSDSNPKQHVNYLNTIIIKVLKNSFFYIVPTLLKNLIKKLRQTFVYPMLED